MTFNLPIRILIAFLASAGLAATQQGGRYSLGGVVVNSRTGEPVKPALVNLVHFNVPRASDTGIDVEFTAPGPPITLTAFTDAAGVFRFNALAPGQYQASVQKPGFTPTQPENPTENPGQVNLSSSMEGIRLNL